MKRLTCGAVAALFAAMALCLPSAGFAQGMPGMSGDAKNDATKAMASSKLPKDELEFFTKAAQSGKTEVAAGKLAAQRSTDPAIKSFAERMVTDHSKANEELMTLAQKKGVTLPSELDSDHQKSLDKLQQSKDFDDDYTDAMHRAHDDAVDLFSKAAKSSDADVKAFAAKTLPTLQSHQAMAKQLDDKH